MSTPIALRPQRDAEAEAYASAGHRAQQLRRKFVAVDAGKLIEMEIAPPEPIVPPWLMAQYLVMVYGPRGIGKSHFSFGIAWAAATGGEFLGWQAPRRTRVLLLDGELQGHTVQQRFAEKARTTGVMPDDGWLRIITPDLQPSGTPDLARVEDQEAIDDLAADAGLIIIDNLSALVRSGGAENDAESWTAIAQWALKCRACGKAVLFVHHAGKGGAQRGTSKREDILDSVIGLRRPNDYTPDQGARFEVHFEKSRHMAGEAVEPFEVQLVTDQHGGQTWALKGLEGSIDTSIIDLYNLGLTVTDIAHELKLNKSNVSRRMAKLRERGMIVPVKDKRNAPRNNGGELLK